ncbi:RGCVC family protein [Actinosynnema sp. ALI-1.44]|uniref:RGCVC family protein n=1 Tax=Actinosynnema sp. ALI-1.44 TaxID=1933779 RepID=UPI00192D0A71|nr:RGCVC family protein [Actinosynnema sp. ALI-1.44]
MSGSTKLEFTDQSDPLCATCPHPWQAHDRIAVRYCIATTHASETRSRGCVCTNKGSR